jgi:hypothetical protein
MHILKRQKYLKLLEKQEQARREIIKIRAKISEIEIIKQKNTNNQ